MSADDKSIYCLGNKNIFLEFRNNNDEQPRFENQLSKKCNELGIEWKMEQNNQSSIWFNSKLSKFIF